MVEQRTENPSVGGSIPPQGTTLAGVAQSAEQLICNQPVAGSIPVTGSTDNKTNSYTGRFQSGQMDQTVNLTSSTSVVQIHLFPPQKRVKTHVFALFCAIFCPFWRIVMCLPPNLPPKFFPINTRPTPRFFAPFRVSLLRRTRLSFAFHHRGGECFTPSVLPRHAASGVSP